MQIPVIGFAGYSGSGKTTVIERLVRLLTARGIRVGVIKHDGHDFEMDHEGKDSWRFEKAGASTTVVTSPYRTAIIEQRPFSLSECAAKIRDVDVILVEGFKNDEVPRIGICRMLEGLDFPGPLEQYIAVISDTPLNATIPVFHFEDIESLSVFILTEMQRQCEQDDERNLKKYEQS